MKRIDKSNNEVILNNPLRAANEASAYLSLTVSTEKDVHVNIDASDGSSLVNNNEVFDEIEYEYFSNRAQRVILDSLYSPLGSSCEGFDEVENEYFFNRTQGLRLDSLWTPETSKSEEL